MSRIRTIKPEFWTSVQVVDCSPTSRLLFIGIWNFVDDRGIHPFCLRTLKMEVFPGDNFTIEQMAEWFDELERAGLVQVYEVDGRRYFVVTGWHHQKIEKPRYKYPEPPAGGNSDSSRVIVDDHSTTSRRPVDDHSRPTRSDTTRSDTTATATRSLGTEGKGGGEISPEISSPSTIALTEFVFDCDGKDAKTWTLTQAKLDEYRESYPSLDVVSEIRKARQWIRDNPGNRKTAGGMPAYLTRWLNKSQNRGATSGKPKSTYGPGQIPERDPDSDW